MPTDLGGIKEILVKKPERYHQLNLQQIQRQSLKDKRDRAQNRDYYWEQDNYIIQQYLENDLTRYYVDSDDIARMKLITLDFFVSAFLKKLCNVYDRPPHFKFDETVKETDEEQFNALMSEVDMVAKMAENQEKMRLHNTIMAHVQYSKTLDIVHIENAFNVGNTFVQPHPEYSLEWDALAYEYMDRDSEVRWVVWDRSLAEHYYLDTKDEFPKFIFEKTTERFQGVHIQPVGLNEDIKAPDYGGEHVTPWVIYRFQDHNGDFWGNGLDSIIELERAINVLLTVTNNDTIRETIRLLVLNFDPTGTEGESGTLKAGLSHPIFPRGGSIGREGSPTAEVVSAELYNTQVIEFVETIVEIVASQHNIESPIKRKIQESLSGVALKLKTEPLIRAWGSDINKLRQKDMSLIRKTVLVNNYYRKDSEKINEKILESLTIDYQDPSIVTEEKAEYELERMKWQDGTSNPVQWLMSQDPEIKTEADAEEIIKNNLKLFRNLGLKSSNGQAAGPAPGSFALRNLGTPPVEEK